MIELLGSGPLIDRLLALFIVFAFLAIPMILSAISRKLDRVVRLLEIANDQRTENR